MSQNIAQRMEYSEEGASTYFYQGNSGGRMSSRFNVASRIRKASNDVVFNLSALEYRHAVLGWCSYLIRPCVTPFSDLRYSDRFTIRSEDGEYICRVDDVKTFDDVFDAITLDNYRTVWPDSILMSLDQVRYKASIQICNSRYRQHIKEHGLPPKIVLIRYSLHKDPKDLKP